MAVENDVVNVRVIVLSTVISGILVIITVWLVAGWFERYEEGQVLRDANYDQSPARQLERSQKKSLSTESGAPEWADRTARQAKLPLEAAKDLAVKTEEERRKK